MAGGGQLYRKLTLFLVAAITVLVGLGLIRAVALMRRGTGANWRDAIGAFFIWQSTSLVVARASVQALFSKRAAFLRTPKTAERAAAWRAFAANWAETLLGVLGLLGIVGALTRVDTVSGPLIAAMLVFPTLGFLSAPANSLAAQRAALPADLRARRRSEWQRQNRAIAGAATAFVGSGAVVAGVVAILALLLAPSPKFAPPNPVRPHDKPSPSAPAAPSPSNEPSPSNGPSQGPSTGPSSGPAPSTGPGPTTSAPQTTPPANPTPGSPAPSS